MKEIIHVISGNFNSVINYNGKKLVVMAENGTMNMLRTSCNGISCYNTTDVSYLTPEFLGQMITYNGNVYIGKSLELGGWFNLSV